MSQICVFITNDAPIACSAISVSTTEIRLPIFRSMYDFTGLTEAKITSYVSCSATGSFTGSLSFQWSHDMTSWNWLGTSAGQPGITFDSIGAKTSGWMTITGSLTGSTSGSEVWIRPVTLNGNGATNIWFNTLTLQAR